MRILFQLPAPVYLRMYGSTVRVLANRGHRVLLCYDAPNKRRDPAAAAVEALEGIVLVPPLPRPRRRYEERIEQLRVAADYVRYLDRRFADAPYLRRRLEHQLSGPATLIARLPYGFPLARPMLRLALALERLVPSDGRVERAIAEHAPDVVVVTPLLGRSTRNRRQTDTVKSARKLRIPVGAGIPTWDHLTTKGVIKARPDRLFVWNAIQLREAVELHRMRAGDVAVTGAPLYDGWFERTPSVSREAFLAGIGLEPGARYVLYVGSSPNIAPPELEIPYVRRWISALRDSGDPVLAGLRVLVRPHPYTVESWADVDPAGIGAAIAPRRSPEIPMSEDDEALYYDSIHFAAAVVGINTSAMVESFIQRRPVLTIRAPEFRETQEGTLHFRDLASAAGDALQAASTLEEHLVQLRSAIEEPQRHRAAIDAFLLAFVRPGGLDVAATPILADAIEGLAAHRV